MADIPKVKRNIQRMIDGGASEAEIDQYLAGEGVTPEQLRAPAPAAAPQGGGSSFGGSLDAAARGVAQGATFGFADELTAGLGGAISWLGLGPEGSEGTFSSGYDRTLANARGMDAKAQEEHPIASIGGEIGGALATAPITGALNVIRAPGVVARTAPAVTRALNAAARGGANVGNAALTGAAYGGLYGFGQGEGGAGERLGSAAEGALMGGAVGGAIPLGAAAARGIGRTVGKVTGIRGALSARNEAARRVTEAATRDARTTGQSVDDLANRLDAARSAGVPMSALDLGEATRGLGRAAADVSPEGRAALNRLTNDRFETQAQRISSVVANAAPGINSPRTSELLREAARRVNKPLYDRAYLEGERGIWHEGLEQLTLAPAMRQAIRGASATGGNKAAVEGVRPPRNPFRENPDGTLSMVPGVRPNLRFWDSVKQNIDDMIETARRSGSNGAARDLTRLKDQLVSYLDEAVPTYRQARATAAEFFGAQDALTAGQNFVRMGGDVTRNAEARRAIQRMSVPERQLFAEGFATQLIGDVQRVKDRASVVKRIFESPAARERFTLALGQQATDDMEMALRVESILDLGREAVQGNSKTARYLSEIVGGGAAGAGVGLYASGGNVMDPSTWLMALFGATALRGAKAAKGALNQRVMREIAELLASDNPQVFRDAIRRITRNPQMMSLVRRGHDRIVKALAPVLAEPGASVAPAFVDGGGSQPAAAGQ